MTRAGCSGRMLAVALQGLCLLVDAMAVGCRCRRSCDICFFFPFNIFSLLSDSS